MYYREPRRPSSRDQQIIEQITHLAGVAIERKLIEEKLRRNEYYLSEAQRLTHTGSWTLNNAGEVYWSEETFLLWGFDPQQPVPDREAILQRVHPEVPAHDGVVVLRLAAVRAQDAGALGECRVVRDHQSRIAESTQVLRGEEGIASEGAEGAHRTTGPQRGERLGRVLYDRKVASFRHLQDWTQIGRLSKEMDRHHRARATGQHPLGGCGIERATPPHASSSAFCIAIHTPIITSMIVSIE